MTHSFSCDERDGVPELPLSVLPDGRARPESHTGNPPAPSLARPPLIRPDQGGSGSAVPALVPGHDRSRLAVLPAVREGRGWEATKGSNGAAQPSDVRNGRTRRESNPHLQNLPHGHRRVPIQDFRPTPSPHPRWPSRRDTCSCPRYRARARKLTLDQESAIRALTGTKSLRALAAEFA
jgi:hypothetical protein